MDIRYLLRGAFAGIVATVVMSVPMIVARRMGLIREQAPERIARSFLVRTGIDRSPGRDEQDVVAALAHLGFGAAGGALFAATAQPLASPGAPLCRVPFTLTGMAYGLGVWAVSYLGWAPALGLHPAPDRDEPARPPLLIASHLLYGAVLARVLGRRTDPRPAGHRHSGNAEGARG